MSYVYGPVPSRRLGQSLGVDTIPLKTCNWNCVYCQLGRTMPLTNERKQYFPREAILTEIRLALRSHRPGEIDWITFVGSGEPTLYSELGWLIQQVKALTTIPVAVITNGSLLHEPDVRDALMPADAVLPTLDAGSPDLYRQINRPHPHIPFRLYIDGLLAFARSYKGHFWPELMLVRGLNDTEEALYNLALIFRRLAPQEIHLNLPTRPPVETWVQPSDEEGLLRARAILGTVARVVHPTHGDFDLSEAGSAPRAIAQALSAIIARHPMTDQELQATLQRWAAGREADVLHALRDTATVQTIERYGVRFWTAGSAYFPEEKASRAVDPRIARHSPSKESE